jgi:caffeoyl-CoA O-methyltransferase
LTRRLLREFAAVEIADPKLEEYAEQHTTPPEPLLGQLAEETRETLTQPQMLTGTIEGRFLELLVHGLAAGRVLELGTYSGYGTLSMAAGLPRGGRIDTCELDPERAAVARRYVEAAGYDDRVTIHEGPALDTIARLDGDFDFVFIDADKENYVNYYEAVLPRLTAHGLIAADNTLWSGRVLDPAEEDASTEAIREFNDHVASDSRVVAVMLTIRDGVTLIRRR